jgi:UDP-N-acetylmuramate--alanine ligase
MISNTNIKRVYLIGIGGIGMSALARYYHALGMNVSGYDRTSSIITDQLVKEGLDIHFSDNIELIPKNFKNKKETLIIYTPAIPDDHMELNFFRDNDYELVKRSQALGKISANKKCIAVAGTHGKTTVSSMITHFLEHSGVSCSAFLGGISKNLNSNILINTNSSILVAEADEFDRSFLSLYPEMAIITSMDADHLDIYESHEKLKDSFSQFVSQIKGGGTLILKKGLKIDLPSTVKTFTYSLTGKADYYADNIRHSGLSYTFDLVTPDKTIKNLSLGVYGRLNLENAVGALSLALLLGADIYKIPEAVLSYKGVWRRFDVQIESDKLLFIDDYAHHPEELKAFISSVREAMPGKRISGIFQPHLYSRTRDFFGAFAESLSLLNDVILLDIYPAREKPIEGVDSGIIFKELTNNGEKRMCTKEQLFDIVDALNPEVLLTMGAGDIDQLVKPIKEFLIAKTA